MNTLIILGSLLVGAHSIPVDPPQESTPSQQIEQNATKTEPSTKIYIVTVNEEADLDQVMQDMKNMTGGKILHVYRDSIFGFSIEVPTGFTQSSLFMHNSVMEVEEDLIFTPMDQKEEGSELSKKAASTGVQVQHAQLLPNGINRVEADLSATAKINGVDEPLNVNIAIIDTGVDKNHPDLNVVYSKGFISGNSSGMDDNGHGTHVAGIAAARDNAIGVVGVAPGARIYSLKVLNSNSRGYLSDVIKAVDWVTAQSKPPAASTKAQKNYEKYMKKYDSEMKKYQQTLDKYQQALNKGDSNKAASYLKKANGYLAKAEKYKQQAEQYKPTTGTPLKNPKKIDVVNMSIGAQGLNNALHKAIQASVAQGVTYVVSAGNNSSDIYGPDHMIYGTDDFIPAAYAEVVTVSAMTDTDGAPGGKGRNGPWSTPDDTIVGFSNYSTNVASAINPVVSPGRGIDVTAPGTEVYSTWLGGGYAYLHGTSMSAPHVTGAVALLIARLGQDVNADGRIDAKDVTILRQLLIGTSSPQSSWGPSWTHDPDPYHEGLLQTSTF